MTRFPILLATLLVAAPLLAGPATAQTGADPHAHGTDTDHAHPPPVGTAAPHSHMTTTVDCRLLTSPPWTGLPASDRDRIASLERSVSGLATPTSARAAGFIPVLGNIPGMGVHWVHPDRSSRRDVVLHEPAHLLFAPVRGEDRLVGVAYAFQDAVQTEVPVPFRSELAHWHDHPQFAPPGQTLHMLHVWFVPSSHGPFAGLNFWLPFHGAGVEPPPACWLEDEADAERIRTISFALAASQRGIGEFLGRWIAGGTVPVDPEGHRREREELIRIMDEAARAEDRERWMDTADHYLDGLTPAESTVVNALLRGLSMAQMSSPQRPPVPVR